MGQSIETPKAVCFARIRVLEMALTAACSILVDPNEASQFVGDTAERMREALVFAARQMIKAQDN